MMEPQGVAPKVPEVAKPSFRLWNCFHLSRPMMIGGFYTIWSIWQRITYIYQQLVDSILEQLELNIEEDSEWHWYMLF